MKYITDSKIEVVQERLGQAAYSNREKFKKLFRVTTKEVDLCGNVRVSFSKTGKAKLTGIASNKGISSWDQISSALALYRAVSMFECSSNPEQQDFYKTNWSVALEHVSTGQVLMLGEWKGGFQIFTQGHEPKDLPKEFINDVEAFLTFFVSNSMPIGYDGVIAGSVA